MTVTRLAMIALFIYFSYPTETEDLAINYIDQYKELAVTEMHRTNIPASIIMAQALLESANGTSKLSMNSNNHFGIKCKKYWTGGKYYHKDDDYDKKGNLTKSCFRSYETIIDSYIDHSNFLKFSDHYAPLFLYDKTDYISWAEGLKACGYATDPTYAEKLIKKIEQYNLSYLDFWEDPNVLLQRKLEKLD